eukprot:3984824-Lingulodinium_polyedra.AAC.1
MRARASRTHWPSWPDGMVRVPCKSQSHPPCGLESIILQTTGPPFSDRTVLASSCCHRQKPMCI